MAVKIRLKRFGRRNCAFWRINAVDSRAARDGKVIEELGYYDPLTKDAQRRVVVDKARVEHWIRVGALPSERVAALLRHATDAATLPPPARRPVKMPAPAPIMAAPPPETPPALATPVESRVSTAGVTEKPSAEASAAEITAGGADVPSLASPAPLATAAPV